MTELVSEVWILRGLFRVEAAELSLGAGRLSLRTPPRALFDVPVEEVERVRSPWHYFGGGLDLTVAGKLYRLTFVTPTQIGGTARDIAQGRADCAAWRNALVTGR